jgi:hypothetical protein
MVNIMVKMKKFLTVLMIMSLFFAGSAFAAEDFELAKSAVDILSMEQMLKEAREEGIMPDDPVDRLAIEMALSEDARLAKEAKEKTNKRDYHSELVGGIWHASPVLGSGWSNRLAFLDDFTFIYAASEMDGVTRERFFEGDWTVSPDGLLKMHFRKAIALEGGEVVPATGSIGTAMEIVGAVMFKGVYDWENIVEIRIGDYVFDDSTPHPRKICLPADNTLWGGDGWWWKYDGKNDLEDLINAYTKADTEAVEYCYTLDDDRIISIILIVGRRNVVKSVTETHDGIPAITVVYSTDPADPSQAANDVKAYFNYLVNEGDFHALKAFDGFPIEGGVEISVARDSDDEGHVIILDIDYNSKGYTLSFKKVHG